MKANIAPMIAIPLTLPTTPPAIAPISLWPELPVLVGWDEEENEPAYVNELVDVIEAEEVVVAKVVFSGSSDKVI
jgi:hypothetical protein